MVCDKKKKNDSLSFSTATDNSLSDEVGPANHLPNPERN